MQPKQQAHKTHAPRTATSGDCVANSSTTSSSTTSSSSSSNSSNGSGAGSSELMLNRSPSSVNSKRHLLVPNSRAKFKQLAALALLLIGLIVCVSSLACILLLPSFIANQISKRLVLKNNSMLLERWSKPNVPMYFKVWLFDVTNAHEVANRRDTKPQLKEIGPFVFHLRRQKDIVSFSGDNLYYTERKIYHFSPELSCCAINTTVTIPNIPLVAVVDRALGYNLPLVGRFIPRLINRAIQSLREQLFVRKQVREILFDGYEVELLKMVSRVGAIVGLPQTNQKFGLLKGRNDTWRPEQDGVWAINTGANDRRQFGRVSSWNSYKKLPFWAAPACNAINGSDGTLFPPPIKTSEPLYIFNQELCRTVNLVYEGTSDIRGIKALKFVLNPMNFAHTMSGSAPGSGLGSGASARRPEKAAHALAQPSAGQPQPLASAAPGDKANLVVEEHESNAAAAANDKRWRLGPGSGAGSGPQHQHQQPRLVSASGLGPPATRAEQEKFVLAAQEAQAQADRRPNERNPFTCFCDRKSTNLNGVNVCEFDGLIDLSKCTKQAQVIFGSMPHFHRSDPRLGRQVAGLQPNASKHTTYLDIEPNTGLVLGGKRRVQLNLLMKHNNEVDGFENINDMLVPLVWFEESALIPEESAQKFKSLYTNRIRLINIVLVSMLLASIGLIAIDLRLLVAGGRWRQFKLVKFAAGAGCQQASAKTKRRVRNAQVNKAPARVDGFAAKSFHSRAQPPTLASGEQRDHSRADPMGEDTCEIGPMGEVNSEGSSSGSSLGIGAGNATSASGHVNSPLLAAVATYNFGSADSNSPPPPPPVNDYAHGRGQRNKSVVEINGPASRVVAATHGGRK